MFIVKSSKLMPGAVLGMIAFGCHSAFAVPPQQVPLGAKIAQAQYACEVQCGSHLPPGVTAQQASQYCPGRCQQLLTFSPAPPPNPPGTTGDGGLNCWLSKMGNAGFYGACQVIWSVTTSGLGSLTSMVAQFLNGNTQLAQVLVGQAKGVSDPCGYLKAQIDAQTNAGICAP